MGNQSPPRLPSGLEPQGQGAWAGRPGVEMEANVYICT